jgi:hypothetical protein
LVDPSTLNFDQKNKLNVAAEGTPLWRVVKLTASDALLPKMKPEFKGISAELTRERMTYLWIHHS